MSGPVTLADVARVAGVSLATASRVLNGSPGRRVRDHLRARVEQAAAHLEYSPNANAQAIARGHTSVVGLIVQDIADPYFSAIAAGAMREAARHDLVITMASSDRDPAQELAFVRVLRQQRARAMIIAGTRINDSGALDALTTELRQFEALGGRVAMVSQHRVPVDTVLIQNRAGARDLAYALHDLGHRRFAVLGTRGTLLTARDRLQGFREALKRRGSALPPDHVVRSEFTRDGGYAAMQEVLNRGLDVTCVFAVNDVMAVGALAALRDRGVRLPDGMAVAGFDDIATLRDVTPSLTTVRLPLEQMGSQAVRLTMEPPAEQPRIQRIAGEVIVRESTPALTPR